MHVVFLTFVLFLILSQITTSLQWIPPRESIVSMPNPSESKMSPHILLNPDFWRSFSAEVEKKKWKCSFSPHILSKGIESDLKMYQNDTILKKRRNGALKWMKNDTLWIITVLGACKEIAYGKAGPFLEELEQLRMDEALKDFVEHIHYFYTIAQEMETKGERVVIKAQNASMIHDIDKLDPVMIVGYSERFEDNKSTSLWNECVDRHIHINTHHQQHCLWHSCCQTDENSCYKIKHVALREMVCDKVARRLQKNFHGVRNDEMWDAEKVFYEGLPEPWVQQATELQKTMKNWDKHNHTHCSL